MHVITKTENIPAVAGVTLSWSLCLIIHIMKYSRAMAQMDWSQSCAIQDQVIQLSVYMILNCANLYGDHIYRNAEDASLLESVTNDRDFNRYMRS